MVFNEREAIRFRMEKIAEEKKVLFQRDQALDREYTFYIERIREIDKKEHENGNEADHDPERKIEKKYSGDLKHYDIEALKKGLSHFRMKSSDSNENRYRYRSIGNDRRRKGKQYNLKEVAKIVEEVLGNYGKPMEISRLRDILEKRGYTWKYFLPALPNIMRHSHRIKKPSRGMIAYIPLGNEGPSEKTISLNKVTHKRQLNRNEDDVSDARTAAKEVPDSVIGKSEI